MPSSTAEESAYILADSAARYAFVEDAAQLAPIFVRDHVVRIVVAHPGVSEGADRAPGQRFAYSGTGIEVAGRTADRTAAGTAIDILGTGSEAYKEHTEERNR